MVSHKAKLAAAALATTLAATSVSASEVNLYSARHYDSDQAIYNAFTEETGIKVNLIEGKSDALIQRIQREREFGINETQHRNTRRNGRVFYAGVRWAF